MCLNIYLNLAIATFSEVYTKINWNEYKKMGKNTFQIMFFKIYILLLSYVILLLW